MSICIFVHETNRSGKSTLARRIIDLCGGVSAYYADTSYKGGSTILKNGIGLLGKYDNACGGMDGFHPAASIKTELKKHTMNPDGKVFAEGLMTFGVETCKEISEMFDRCIFILLDTEIPQCIEYVKQRRSEKGNTKEYSPEHLYKKAKSAYSWYLNLLQEGLECYRLKFDDALRCVKYYFNLEESE